jgi:hypothetical protein
LKDYEARLGKPFAHEAFMSELANLRDQLKLGLSEHPPEGLPPVAELAERIGALRAANTVEAAPERTLRKAARAERPVTERIGEWIGEIGPVAVAEEATQVAAIEPPAEDKPAPFPDLEPVVIRMPEKPMNGHAKTVAKRRQVNKARLRLF